MEVKIREMVGRVLKLLDENEEILSEKMEFGYPETNLMSLIAEMLPEVAEQVVRESPLSDIDEWLEMDGECEWVSPGHGEVELPLDFLRLVTFRMSDWRRKVSTVISPDSSNYSLYFDARGARRGVRKSPAVALVNGATRRRLEFVGSTTPGAYVEIAGYLPLPQRDDPDALWIPRSLLGKVAEASAAKVKSICES